MATSRNRRTGNRSTDVRRARMRRDRVERRRAREEAAGPRLPRLSEEDLAHLEASAGAEAAGDAAEALRLCSRVPDYEHSLHRTHLATLVELGDDAPAWLCSRWATLQAQRSALLDVPDGGPDPALLTVLQTVYARGVDPAVAEELSPQLFVASLYRRDWVLRQLHVYDGGGLRRFLEHRAGDGLLLRCDQPMAWAYARMGGYRLGSDEGGTLRVTDLRTGEPLEVLDLGLLAQHWPGQCVIGRLVPTRTAPGLMFEWQPLPVDEETALEVAREPRPGWWLETVTDRAAAEKLPLMFSYLEEPSLVTDLPQRAWAGLLEPEQIPALPRREHGLIDYDDVALETLGNVLDDALRFRAEVAGSRHVIAALLLEPGLRERIEARYAVPARALAWRLLEGVVPEPARSRCAAYAALAERGGRAA